MIPQIIWQTHELPYEELPNFQKNIINTWKNLNPGWKHIYEDADQRAKDVKEYSDILYRYYSVAQKVHQSDIWRLVTIYNNGGFYADMDSICIEKIQDSMGRSYNGEELICSSIGFQHYGVNNSNFGAIKNSKIIKSIIDFLLIQYSHFELEHIPDFDFGFPVNSTFSAITQKNKNLVYFNEDYFSHSKDLKYSFNPTDHIYYNNKQIDYLALSDENNWIID